MRYESRLRVSSKRAVLLAGCLVAWSMLVIPLCSYAGSELLTAERPGDEAFRPLLKKEPSNLNVLIETSTNEITGVLNRTLRKDLYKGATTTSGVTADVVRNGPLSVSAADDYLFVTLPVTMSLSYGMFAMQPLPLTLKFKVKAAITPDWRIHTEIHYLGLSDKLAGEVSIGPLSFKPRSIVEGVIKPVQKDLSALVEQKINDQFHLKTEVAKVWHSARKPFLLDRNYNAWLKLTTREVVMSPVYARNNLVRMSVGINTFAELVMGPEPAGQPPLPLPNLKQVNSFDKTFRIALNADLFYKDLRDVAAKLLLDKQFESDGNSIVVKDLDLYGNGEKLVVKLQTEGSLNGLFYLTARPAFNPQTGMFSVEDVDFDLQTRNLLHRTGDWFLHSTIRSMLQEKLNMNLTGQLEQVRQMAGNALTRMQLAEHVFLKAEIKTLKFNEMIVQKDRLSIQVSSEGDSTVFFQ